MLDSDIAVLRPAERSESLPKRNDAGHYFRIVLGVWMQERDATHALARLRPRRKWPRCRTAEQRDELAASHSITSSAATSSVGGTVRPSAFAVLRLISSSNLV